MSRPLDELDRLAVALVGVGRRVRDAVRGTSSAEDGSVVRTEGGDDVYGVDVRAEEALLVGLAELGDRWPGQLVTEGFDDPLPIGRPAGSPSDPVEPNRAGEGSTDPGWVYLADPVDGTRPYLAGLRSAWVLLGAGRQAASLEELEVGVAVEIPTMRAALGRVVWATSGQPAHAVDDDLTGQGRAARPVELRPRSGSDPNHSFLTVVRLTPGQHGPIGAWADDVLDGWEVYDDLVPCSGGLLHSVADGSATAVLDPRPLLSPGSMATHPYDLAAIVAMRAAGVVVEALPPGALDGPLDPEAPVAWACYANDQIAEQIRERMRAVAAGWSMVPQTPVDGSE